MAPSGWPGLAGTPLTWENKIVGTNHSMVPHLRETDCYG
jgi:hypothetical protein